MSVGDSDLITAYNAYSAWRRICKSNGSSEYEFCRRNYLSQQTLSNIEDLKAQLTTTIIEAGLLVLGDSETVALNRSVQLLTYPYRLTLPGLASTRVRDIL